MAPKPAILEKGEFSFTIESRILRELGERLVKQPDVAVLELLKNSYDADADTCVVDYKKKHSIAIIDDGVGMSLERFRDAWMRIGTSSKEAIVKSPKYGRLITGEKGIGRFSVRFLGKELALESTTYDTKRRRYTRLIANFDWPKFDQHEDLGKVSVPYRLEAVAGTPPTGTTLVITRLRPEATKLDLRRVRTGSLGLLSPLRSLFVQDPGTRKPQTEKHQTADPGFQFIIQGDNTEEEDDVGQVVLNNFVLRATLRVVKNTIAVQVFRKGVEAPYVDIKDTYPNDIGTLRADIRFFPHRTGTFTSMPIDGRAARSWISANAGVAIYDRGFRVLPYGTPSDDWLHLLADSARSERKPRSPLSDKYFRMSQKEMSDPSQNWMIRLPEAHQLVGVVQVEGRRTKGGDGDRGLIASADREGFLENLAFAQLVLAVRGAVEAMAYADRKIGQEEEAAERKALLSSLRRETRSAIAEVQGNPNITKADKAKIVTALAETQSMAENHARSSKERERQLEVMSLLGVVAGFMTHEFGAALKELETAQKELTALLKQHPHFGATINKIDDHIKSLRDFVTYSSGYIQGSKITPTEPYPARPRIVQVKRIFGRYAEEREISVDIDIDGSLKAPLVPPSLYNGLALNLYTNALKAVTAQTAKTEGRILFRAYNDGKWHNLEVLDNGIGIPATLQDRVFDPLFTTTEKNRDPLGSGMGLGLALVRRGAEAFGGRADVVDADEGFSTCVRIRLPLN